MSQSNVGTNIGVKDAPTRALGILRYSGPGLIIAASVVGSGELIATTKTGAQAGIVLLWLVVIGCLMKIGVQLALGHYAVTSGKGTMQMLGSLPGPRIGTVNWVLAIWFVMQIATIAQLGGIAHGVGQALAISAPLTDDYRSLLDSQDKWDREAAMVGTDKMTAPRPTGKTGDDVYWAGIAIAATVLLLLLGRYKVVEIPCTYLVVAFTLVTVFCVAAIQYKPEWALTTNSFISGMSFKLPSGPKALTTALSTLGIIGMGATDLIGYIYWIRERGYHSFTGPRDLTDEWAGRARGWMRVMRYDALVSAAIYTFATVSFYLLGAAVLHPQGLDPTSNQMIKVLSQMYVPVFGHWTESLFLVGSFAVLYSTLFAGTATHSRVCADALGVFGFSVRTEEQKRTAVKVLIVVFPLVAFGFLLLFRQPVLLVLMAGVSQGIMLPILAWAAIYLRYKHADQRIAHGRFWDVVLWISSVGLLITGAWMILNFML